ncbi:hypothetical protein [Streptomyces sp. NPDC088762]|uniref:hypothetical protein n=1 Tax=Streptomyces sp. NPDC088762 TaxID=3365891 RepID=UPI0037F6862D
MNKASQQTDHDHSRCGMTRSSKRCCVRGLFCLSRNLSELPAYERRRRLGRGIPNDRIDAYLDVPPVQRPEARVIRGRDDDYLPTSWASVHDAEEVKNGHIGWWPGN